MKCGMDWVDSRYASSSDVFATCPAIKNVTFGSEEVKNKFYAAQGNRGTMNALGITPVVKTLRMLEDPTVQNSIEYGAQLSGVGLPAGWVWADPDTAVTVNNSGYMAYYTPVDTDTLDWTYNEGLNETEKRSYYSNCFAI